MKLARSTTASRRAEQRRRSIARETAYHGTTLGALAATGIPGCATPFEPLTPGGCHVPNTNAYRWPRRTAIRSGRPTRSRSGSSFEGPETVAAVILEPVQNAGGCFAPPEGYFQRVREICDRHGVLLISDEVICSWGRLGHVFGCERYDYQPDIITTAKGLTTAYTPMGAMIVVRHVAEPFMQGSDIVRARLHVRRPPGRRGGARSRTSTSSSARISAATCAPTRARSAAMLEGLRDIDDRRRHARRRLLPRARARQGPGHEGDVQRRGVGGAAARLPLRRAVSSGPDLPRRRPWRPGDPALAAADRRARGVRGDRSVLRPVLDRGRGRGSPTRADADRPSACCPRSGSSSRAGTRSATDAPVRWVHITELARPDALADRRRAAADDRDRSLATTPRQRAYVAARSSRTAIAGLGFGARLRARRAARRRCSRPPQEHGLPVFEVPYELPFIAITERAFAHLVSEQYAALRRSIADPGAPRAARARGARPRRGHDDGRGGDRRQRDVLLGGRGDAIAAERRALAPRTSCDRADGRSIAGDGVVGERRPRARAADAAGRRPRPRAGAGMARRRSATPARSATSSA